MELVKVLKALGDENRVRILNLLRKRNMCVCELETVLNITQSNVSRHLLKLKEADIIDFEKQGLYVFYKINEPILEQYSFIQNILNRELDLIQKLGDDLARLERLKRDGQVCRIE
ncbi:MAG TPA: metalloregulator ArsR/SmtB family transcription factor [Bacillota bacterium]|nr:metalloregulator ArsR/SmtB family transcription factor [Bacillota bacterium]